MEDFATPQKSNDVASIAAALKAPQHDDATRSKPISVSLPWETSFGQDKLAFVVPSVLTEEECDAIIRICEARGFEQALLNAGFGRQVLATDVRKSGRCIIDDVRAAEMLCERLKHAIPDECYPHWPDSTCAWQCVGLNERFRVLKYQPGDYFAPHRDGSFVRPEGVECPPMGKPGDTSFFTLMLYLNTPTKGGGTNFLSVAGHIRPFNPSTGQALIFDHGIRHEGAILETGVKYAIRTDVMYRRLPTAENVENEL